MPRKKKNEIDSKLQEKLDYIGLNLDKIPPVLTEYTRINFRAIKGYDEKKYRQYRYINVNEIEVLLSPTHRIDSIKDKYENAEPLCFYLDSKNEENLLNYTTFLNMLNKVTINQIKEAENEQKKLSKDLPFKVKFTGNYLWQIYYSNVSKKYFMIVPIEDTDYSTFFYLLKKKIENKKNEKIFVPISLVDYEGELLKREEIKDLENYLWLFTKDYPLIYETWNKGEDVTLNIVGETEIYDNIKTLYKVSLSNKKDASKFYKLLKALFILQTELPHYYKFNTNIDKNARINFLIDNNVIEYETLPEFIMEQYLKSVSLKNRLIEDLDELIEKLENLKNESDMLEKEYISKEKEITTYLECKKTFFGKVKYFFKMGKKSKETESNNSNLKEKYRKIKSDEEREKHKKSKLKLEERNYTLYELEQSFKELEEKEEEAKKKIMDINALKLKNKNLKKKIENATNYIEEINKHKRSIFEFWKYSNKDAVATLDEGEQEEFNVKKIEKVFDYEEDFEEFGIQTDKFQRNKYTDSELDSIFIATTPILRLLNRMNQKVAENKEISEELKNLKIEKDSIEDDEDSEESFNIFGRIKQSNNKERVIGNKVHREQPRDKYEILEIKKGCKGVELKMHLENVLNDIKSALEKNELQEDMYVYKISTEPMELDTIEAVSLDVENEMKSFLKNDKTRGKIYLYKIRLPKGTNFIAFTNIIFFDNKNMTLPVGMNLSSKILVDFESIHLNDKKMKNINKLQFENDEDDFSEIIIKEIKVTELK